MMPECKYYDCQKAGNFVIRGFGYDNLELCPFHYVNVKEMLAIEKVSNIPNRKAIIYEDRIPQNVRGN